QLTAQITKRCNVCVIEYCGGTAASQTDAKICLPECQKVHQMGICVPVGALSPPLPHFSIFISRKGGRDDTQQALAFSEVIKMFINTDASRPAFSKREPSDNEAMFGGRGYNPVKLQSYVQRCSEPCWFLCMSDHGRGCRHKDTVMEQ
ncbi:hypothetical protein GBF38_011605, partial [Nibea albiflora]